jgi:hypothetical protein
MRTQKKAVISTHAPAHVFAGWTTIQPNIPPNPLVANTTGLEGDEVLMLGDVRDGAKPTD